jgi:hypothetical protein
MTLVAIFPDSYDVAEVPTIDASVVSIQGWKTWRFFNLMQRCSPVSLLSVSAC